MLQRATWTVSSSTDRPSRCSMYDDGKRGENMIKNRLTKPRDNAELITTNGNPSPNSLLDNIILITTEWISMLGRKEMNAQGNSMLWRNIRQISRSMGRSRLTRPAWQEQAGMKQSLILTLNDKVLYVCVSFKTEFARSLALNHLDFTPCSRGTLTGNENWHCCFEHWVNMGSWSALPAPRGHVCEGPGENREALDTENMQGRFIMQVGCKILQSRAESPVPLQASNDRQDLSDQESTGVMTLRACCLCPPKRESLQATALNCWPPLAIWTILSEDPSCNGP